MTVQTARLTPSLQHLLSCFGNVQSLRILPAVPNKQLRVWWYRLDGIEINVEANLARNEILLTGTVAEVHIMHPVTATCVSYVHIFTGVIFFEDLRKE